MWETLRTALQRQKDKIRAFAQISSAKSRFLDYGLAEAEANVAEVEAELEENQRLQLLGTGLLSRD
jgi:hypothetical protein